MQIHRVTHSIPLLLLSPKFRITYGECNARINLGVLRHNTKEQSEELQEPEKMLFMRKPKGQDLGSGEQKRGRNCLQRS